MPFAVKPVLNLDLDCAIWHAIVLNYRMQINIHLIPAAQAEHTLGP